MITASEATVQGGAISPIGLRKSMRAPAYVAATEGAAASEGDESDRAAERLDVQRALDGLSEKLRAVVDRGLSLYGRQPGLADLLDLRHRYPLRDLEALLQTLIARGQANGVASRRHERTATAAASVAVKMPATMPPITITSSSNAPTRVR